PTHKTPALDNRICPQSDSSTSTIDTNPFPEGTNRFVGKAKDVAGNVGTTQQWTVKVDRTAPLVTSGFTLVDFEPTDGIGEVDWQNAGDPALPDGTPGSGVGSYLVRFNVNGGGWTDWQSTPESNLVFDAGNVGDTLQIEVQVFDNVGNASPVAAGSVTLAAVDGVDHPDTATDEDTAEAALMRDWGVTADEAAARVDRQASIEAMDDYLTTNNPDTYGGLWVDEADGGAAKVA